MFTHNNIQAQLGQIHFKVQGPSESLHSEKKKREEEEKVFTKFQNDGRFVRQEAVNDMKEDMKAVMEVMAQNIQKSINLFPG